MLGCKVGSTSEGGEVWRSKKKKEKKMKEIRQNEMTKLGQKTGFCISNWGGIMNP